MNSCETKPQLFFRLNDFKPVFSNSYSPNDLLQYEFASKTNPNLLLISNSENAYKLSLKCQNIFLPQQGNPEIFEKLTDSKSPIISNLLKGFNVLICNMGKSGSGKTNGFFGNDSAFNDTTPNFNLLASVYRKIKGNLKPGEESLYVFSVSIAEIIYNEELKVELMKDLLDVSDSVSTDTFTKGFLSVIFKSEEELEEILYFSRLRSENWRSNYNEEGNIQEFKFLCNKAHLIVNLNIMNIRTKKINSFSLFDLIGFRNSSKKDIKQISLAQLMNFLNEFIANKDNLVKFKKEVTKNVRHTTGTMNYSALSPKHMNFVNLFANYFLNSHSFFYLFGNSNNDYYQDSHVLYDKLAEISSINYTLEKKQVINYSQFLNFPSFIKSTEIFINNYTEEDNRNEKNQDDAKEENFEEIEEGNKKNTHDSKSSNISEKLNSELKNIYQKIDKLNERMNFSEITEESEENERSLPNSAKLDTKKSTPKTPKHEEKSIINNRSAEKQEERMKSEEKASQGVNQTSIYEIYDRKVKNIMTTLLNYEFPTNLNKGDLYIMKRNYELLLNLFQEGEDIRKNLMIQFVELKDNLLEFKAEFDLKLNDEKLKNLELQKKIRLLSNESDSKLLIQSYETEIQKLMDDKNCLIRENERILKELLENPTAIEEGNISISNVRNTLLKNNRNLLIKIQEKDKEIAEYRKKERSFLSGQKVLESVTNKNSTILKTLTEKENQERKVIEICGKLEKENEDLKKKLNEIQKNYKGLSEEYFKNKEQMFLFKEMAKAPENFFTSQIKKNTVMISPSKQKSQEKNFEDGGQKAKKTLSKENKEKLFESLKSLGD